MNKKYKVQFSPTPKTDWSLGLDAIDWNSIKEEEEEEDKVQMVQWMYSNVLYGSLLINNLL